MEKIQSAIAKARAARANPATAATPRTPAQDLPEPMVLSDASAAVTAAVARPAAASPAEVDAAWADLAPVRLDPRHLQRNRIVAHGSGSEAVPFDMMRTRFLQQMRLNGWTRIAVTSPSPSCGKSTVAANLAFSLARQSDLRVILAEVDLRRPVLTSMLGIAARHSFGGVLSGSAQFGDNAVRSGENLAIATSALPMRASAEVLQAPRAAEVIAAIDARYAPSVMIFDMPPMLVGDDVMAFADKVDCVLLIAAAESSTIAEVDSCERDLAQQTNVLGVVLNKCRYLEKSYGYYS